MNIFKVGYMSKNAQQIDEQTSFLVKKIETYQKALDVQSNNSLLEQIAQREDGKELLNNLSDTYEKALSAQSEQHSAIQVFDEPTVPQP